MATGKYVVGLLGLLSLFLWIRYGRDDEHKVYKSWEKKIKTSSKWVFIILLPFFTFIIAPYNKYNAEKDKNDAAQKILADKSARLNGFINQSMTADEPGTTNSLIFLQVEVGNSGGNPSIADHYKLRVILTNNLSTNAEQIDFSDEYKLNAILEGKPYLIDLKRPELISEKTSRAIQPGDSPRGWIAFRLPGIPVRSYYHTNLILSFSDIHDNTISVTNGLWNGKSELRTEKITKTFPGSGNLMIPIELPAVTNTEWLPPELPKGCSNILVFFGANGMNYPRIMAEISSEGKKFAIKDLPDFYLQGMDQMPGYSRRQKDIWIKSDMATSIGGKTIPYPIRPMIVSNRLYVEVQVPFSNEKQKLVMNDDFDTHLPIPDQWDRNYSTNYYANGLESGGIYAYEIVNELTNPVLQVVYSAPNEVHVNGIFKVDETSTFVSFGQQPMLLTFSNSIAVDHTNTNRITTVSLEATNFFEVLHIYTNDSVDSIGQMLTNEYYRPVFQGQRRLFKYPSNRNLGAFNDETNASR